MRQPTAKSKPAPTKAAALVVARPHFPAWLPAALLALVTLVLYWPAMSHDFINYDDDLYVTANVHVQKGLTWENLKWAFLNPMNDNWHPLTVLSHELDCQLFGLNPRGHHLTSVLLHTLNAALVFMLLLQLTGARWRSFFVAALFAVHPLHVESVAWVSERKDVLSACFGLLSLMCYVRFVKQIKIQNSKFKIYYGLALLCFALGLMSKAMLVTWPFVLLLLDYWPLERFKPGRARRLVAEKIPFFALAAAASVVTFLAQKQGGAVVAVENLSLGVRGGNALISYCRYLGKLFWPAKLAVFYPLPDHWPMDQVLLAGGLLAGISALLIVPRRRYPWLLMGWLWFTGTLAPVIGLVQAGEQAMADRYTYIPSIGLFILAVWGAYELARRWQITTVLSVAGSAAIALCLGLTRQQLGYWRDSEALFRHTLEVTENNFIAHDNLGSALLNQGQVDEAIRQFQEALRLRPAYAEAHYNLGTVLGEKGQINEAIRQFQEALRLKPEYAEARLNLGIALYDKGQTAEAVHQFQGALHLKPDYAEARLNLGIARYDKGQTDEAVRQFQEALRLKPDYAEAHSNLGNALYDKGQTDEAIRQFQEALRLKPDYAEAHSNLGNALYDKGQTDEAIHQFQEALRLKPDYAEAHNDLGNVLTEKGQANEAIHQFQEALRLKPDYAQAHYNLGTALLKHKQGQVDEAIRQLQEAIRLKPDFFEAHNALGVALGMKGQVDEAIRQFQEALRLKPDDAGARNNLARAVRIKNAPATR